MEYGTVKFFKQDKGYGFVINEETNKETFFHVSALLEGNSIERGEKVEYEVETGRKGLNAVNIAVI